MDDAQRLDILLLFLDCPSGTYPTDQVRVVKGLFLISRDFPELDEDYDFKPYNYGPFSPRIYRDLDQLQIDGLIVSTVIGQSRREFRLTERGIAEAVRVRQNLDTTLRETICARKRFVTSLGFEALLLKIYEEFEEFSVNTILQAKTTLAGKG